MRTQHIVSDDIQFGKFKCCEKKNGNVNIPAEFLSCTQYSRQHQSVYEVPHPGCQQKKPRVSVMKIIELLMKMLKEVIVPAH